MRILLLAPQPFFVERGTPIAVRQLAETLCAAGHEVDLLAYHEGEEIAFPGLRLLRIPRLPLVRGVRIGFSWKKLACDAALVLSFLRLARPGRYQVVHAGEETIFPAALFAWRHRAALVYDMDSDLADQLLAKHRFLRPLRGLLETLERWALGRADLTLAVCERLAEKARALAPRARVRVLEDVALTDACAGPLEDLRALARPGDALALYVGNLERYQGIDLLLDAIVRAGADTPLTLAVVGGAPADVERYRAQAAALGTGERVRFLGPRPVQALGGLLAQADILVSPRVQGENTPMKIYSYLASGRCTLATDIASHTQALDDTCALLAPPEPAAFAAALRRLAGDPLLRAALGRAGARRARERHSPAAYRAKLLAAYAELPAARATAGAA
ncbi:MAG TPA: glycosyltransferase family 4 protein [Candidatus Methanoperedens sp.]|nr:glycosyltransferase family 4 protein [Candidatus Methanoperedens sp.]